MDNCRIALIGAGNVARRHARVLSEFPDVQLAGVTDVQPAAAAALAADAGCRVYPDAETLLADGVDAAYVCAPPFAHGAPEEAVRAAGVPLFVEKPLAVAAGPAERIGAGLAASGLRTAVGHHWRYLDVVEQAQRVLDGRPVRLISGAWLDKVPPVGWWPVRARSGGPVVEQAVHVLDLARVFAGEAAEVYATGNGQPPTAAGTGGGSGGAGGAAADVDSATVAALRFRDGAVGTLGVTCSLSWKQRAGLEVVADGLWLSVSEDELIFREGSGDPVHAAGDPAAARVAVDRAFVDVVRGIGDDVRVPYAEALRTHRLACALAESAATGTPVRLAGAPVGH